MEKKKERKKERDGGDRGGDERNAASPLSSRFSFDSYLSSLSRSRTSRIGRRKRFELERLGVFLSTFEETNK